MPVAPLCNIVAKDSDLMAGIFIAPVVNYFSLAFDLHSPSARPNRRAKVPSPALGALPAF